MNPFICITSYGGYIGRLGWVNQGRYSIVSPAGRRPSHGWWRLRPASHKWIGDDYAIDCWHFTGEGL